METSEMETGFSIGNSKITFGSGVTREVGYEMTQAGSKRVMVVTDPKLAHGEAVSVALKSLSDYGIDAVLFDQVSVEPTDVSFKEAIAFGKEGQFDGYVAVGGGSSIDTAKAVDLYATYPADFLTYVNAPIGEARPVPGPLKPMIAIPTTSGTGSETTGVAIFDFLEMKTKTGISHRALQPMIGLVDPDNTRTLPKMVAACSGLDVLCHALESYTALPFSERVASSKFGTRPPYQGANPISDVWALRAIEILSANILRAVNDKDDYEARSNMLLAATFAGIGFGNAGVHLPHGMSYPVSGMVSQFTVEGYPCGCPLVPHGMSVVLNAPAVFRFTGVANPERHLTAAKLMGAPVSNFDNQDAGSALADEIIKLMKTLEMPNGLGAIGYTDQDVQGLVSGALPQRRVIDLSPRPVDESVLRCLFIDSMKLW